MKMTRIRWGLAALALAALTGCGGGGGGSSSSLPTGSSAVATAVTAAAANAANDTQTDASKAFTVLQDAGVPVVAVASPPIVSFTLFDNGKVVSDLVERTTASPATAQVRAIIAKLVPGTNGEPDKWVSYTSVTKTPTGAAAAVAVSASAVQATTDDKNDKVASSIKGVLKFDSANGYYTYAFRTDIKDIAQTYGVTYEPSLTHRVAVQVKYVNSAGVTVNANPTFDFTIDANGKAVAVTDTSKTRKMVDVNSCNSCHNQLAMHGGGRVDTQYCVLCHNTGTTDPVSGNVVVLSNMVHSVHAGKRLAAAGQSYAVSTTKYDEVGFPQDLRNCTKCHTGQDPNPLKGEALKTPQGDNWKTAVSKEACLSCHARKDGSAWEVSHKAFAQDPKTNPTGTATSKATDLTNAQCKACHAAGTPVSPENVHWNQNEENGLKYKMVIEGATYNATSRVVTVNYFLADPTNANAPYDIQTAECNTATDIKVKANTDLCATKKFGNLKLYLAYQNLIGQPTNQTEWTGGSGINIVAYKGTVVEGKPLHYSVDLPAIPADLTVAEATAASKAPGKAFGTARVFSIGQIKEAKLDVKSNVRPRPEVIPAAVVNTIVQNATFDISLDSSAVNPRREVVSTEKCNACHGALGTSSGSNTLSEAFHGGARDIVQACPACHDVNRASTGNMMTNGSGLYESFQFKRMIHGIHGNTRRTYPFTHGNKVVDTFNKDGTSTTVGNPSLLASVENYAAEVAWPGGQDFKAPGTGVNCNVCHVNNSYQTDFSPLATVVLKPTGVLDPMLWNVITPMAATCSGCHDSSAAVNHMANVGKANFGTTATQKVRVQEECRDCHAVGAVKGVDVVHGQ